MRKIRVRGSATEQNDILRLQADIQRKEMELEVKASRIRYMSNQIQIFEKQILSLKASIDGDTTDKRVVIGRPATTDIRDGVVHLDYTMTMERLGNDSFRLNTPDGEIHNMDLRIGDNLTIDFPVQIGV